MILFPECTDDYVYLTERVREILEGYNNVTPIECIEHYLKYGDYPFPTYLANDLSNRGYLTDRDRQIITAEYEIEFENDYGDCTHAHQNPSYHVFMSGIDETNKWVLENLHPLHRNGKKCPLYQRAQMSLNVSTA